VSVLNFVIELGPAKIIYLIIQTFPIITLV